MKMEPDMCTWGIVIRLRCLVYMHFYEGSFNAEESFSLVSGAVCCLCLLKGLDSSRLANPIIFCVQYSLPGAPTQAIAPEAEGTPYDPTSLPK